ncbi:MAG: trigger factor [Ruminococcus sp.]|nr:trigger factor [Ruminococcus sp.]
MNLKSSTKTDVNMTELVIEINAESFENAVESAYRRQKKNISMPGFRKGKIPRKLCEKTYGENVFYEDAINTVLNAELPGLVEKAGLDLVDSPRVELTSVSKEKGASLKVVCVTKPEIHITEYKGLEAVRNEKEITDEDVQNQLENLQKRNAREVSVDNRATEMGDTVTLDFEGFFGDEAFEGGKGENYELPLGSGQFIPGFEEQVVGNELEKPFDVNVTFPENYSMEDYAGKEAVFHCIIHGITHEELPELDDEFVKDTSEFDTLDELKTDIHTKLEESTKNAADQSFENAIIEQLIELVEDPIPHVMFERRADALLNQFAAQLQEQGVSMDMYLQYTGMDQDSLKATYLERAEGEVKLRLALEQIAKQENVEVTDEELDEEVKKIAESSSVTEEQIRSAILDDVRTDLLVKKALDLVKEAAVIIDAPTEEPVAEESADATEEAVTE